MLLTRFIGTKRVILPIAKHDQRDIRFLKDLIEDGAFTAVIDRRYPLWLLHKAVSEKLLRDRGDGRQSGWVWRPLDGRTSRDG